MMVDNTGTVCHLGPQRIGVSTVHVTTPLCGVHPLPVHEWIYRVGDL
jgi:hypothetical protein